MNHETLRITTPSEREIAMTRVFQAPRHLVFAAYTQCPLLKRWLGVFGGWELAVCEIDLRVGGEYRWVWRKGKDTEMGMGGVFREVVPNEKLVSRERFDDAWYEGEALVTATFTEDAGKTTLVATMRYDSKAIRDSVLQSPMESGVAASYDKLAEVLATMGSK